MQHVSFLFGNIVRWDLINVAASWWAQTEALSLELTRKAVVSDGFFFFFFCTLWQISAHLCSSRMLPLALVQQLNKKTLWLKEMRAVFFKDGGNTTLSPGCQFPPFLFPLCTSKTGVNISPDDTYMDAMRHPTQIDLVVTRRPVSNAIIW